MNQSSAGKPVRNPDRKRVGKGVLLFWSVVVLAGCDAGRDKFASSSSSIEVEPPEQMHVAFEGGETNGGPHGSSTTLSFAWDDRCVDPKERRKNRRVSVFFNVDLAPQNKDGEDTSLTDSLTDAQLSPRFETNRQ